jgi:hypothetical protein
MKKQAVKLLDFTAKKFLNRNQLTMDDICVRDFEVETTPQSADGIPPREGNE